MRGTSKLATLTVEEYLASEERSAARHEYIDGHLFAMAGATSRHNTITQNITFALRQHLRGSKCRAYTENLKVRVEATNSFYYPDVFVTCDGKAPGDDVYCESPFLIVEVLSRATAAIDRREKLFAYRRIPTLQEYLIVHQTTKRVVLHRRTESGEWQSREFEHSALVQLDSPGTPFDLLLDVIYEDIDFPHSGLFRESAEAEYDEGAFEW
jgi:Uma2 family endonuclease